MKSGSQLPCHKDIFAVALYYDTRTYYYRFFMNGRGFSMLRTLRI